jgi:undecaprenyl-diphosphatase
MGTIVAVGMLTYVAFHWLEAPIARRLLIAGVTLWVLLIGFSRMFLGVHYLSDVAGGLAAGAAWLALSIKAIERAKRDPKASLARSHVKE